MTSASCVDPISFETTTGQSQLVFYGTFSQLNEDHPFSIAQTNDFGKPGTPVSGAAITIYDDQGNSAAYVELDSGNYQLGAAQLEAIPHRSYHVEILLTDGRAFTSVASGNARAY